MDWTLAVIVAVAVVGAYIGGRWHEKGRIDAIAASLTKVIEQEKAKAESVEHGKNLARKEDLENIVAEVRAITATQKEIEAKISGDAWRRQWILDHKREFYVDLLKLISEARLD